MGFKKKKKKKKRSTACHQIYVKFSVAGWELKVVWVFEAGVPDPKLSSNTKS